MNTVAPLEAACEPDQPGTYPPSPQAPYADDTGQNPRKAQVTYQREHARPDTAASRTRQRYGYPNLERERHTVTRNSLGLTP